MLTIAALPAQTQTVNPADPVNSRPWQEAVISVSDPVAVAGFLREVAGWEQIGRSNVDRALLDAWGLDAGARADSWLFRNPGDDHGYVRLVSFKGVEQVQIRSGAQPWDTGGIFSLMVRTPDVDARFAAAQRMHWSSYSDPISVDFGTSELRTVVLRGPDGINFSLYERVRPPLESFENMRRFSLPFNAMQTVRDVEAAAAFYGDILGFGTWYRGGSASEDVRRHRTVGFCANFLGAIAGRRHTGILFGVPRETLNRPCEWPRIVTKCYSDPIRLPVSFAASSYQPDIFRLNPRIGIGHLYGILRIYGYSHALPWIA
jgi:catechol 2,3-dioxygenase-like lactoylglutathione lyase family enzyme